MNPPPIIDTLIEKYSPLATTAKWNTDSPEPFCDCVAIWPASPAITPRLAMWALKLDHGIMAHLDDSQKGFIALRFIYQPKEVAAR
jgi:hypothetical protein